MASVDGPERATNVTETGTYRTRMASLDHGMGRLLVEKWIYIMSRHNIQGPPNARSRSPSSGNQQAVFPDAKTPSAVKTILMISAGKVRGAAE